MFKVKVVWLGLEGQLTNRETASHVAAIVKDLNLVLSSVIQLQDQWLWLPAQSAAELSSAVCRGGFLNWGNVTGRQELPEVCSSSGSG